jgi:hypothetical protein
MGKSSIANAHRNGRTRSPLTYISHQESVMEEKLPGQDPEAERRAPSPGVYERAAPPPQGTAPTGKERELIDAARRRADRDREELRASGHGDHKGEEGF